MKYTRYAFTDPRNELKVKYLPIFEPPWCEHRYPFRFTVVNHKLRVFLYLRYVWIQSHLVSKISSIQFSCVIYVNFIIILK